MEHCVYTIMIIIMETSLGSTIYQTTDLTLGNSSQDHYKVVKSQSQVTIVSSHTLWNQWWLPEGNYLQAIRQTMSLF